MGNVFDWLRAFFQPARLLGLAVNGFLFLFAAQLFARLSAERRVFFTMPNTYEMFGLDFVVDSGGTAWLLEVNRTPGLVGRAEVDRAVKDAVVDAAWGGSSAEILEELLL